MSLIICPECGNEVSDMAVACPKCGRPIANMVNPSVAEQTVPQEDAEQKQTAFNFQAFVKKNKYILVIAALAVLYFSFFNMSANDKLALSDCKELRNMLKDPNSFVLSDNIYLYESEGVGTIVYIAYGAENSYGTTVYDVAVFGEEVYKGQMGDNDSDSFLLEYAFPLAYTKVHAMQSGEADFSQYKKVNGAKIARKMKADFLDLEMITSLNFDT